MVIELVPKCNWCETSKYMHKLKMSTKETDSKRWKEVVALVWWCEKCGFPDGLAIGGWTVSGKKRASHSRASKKEVKDGKI